MAFVAEITTRMEALKEVHTFEDGSMYMKKRRRDLPSKCRRDVHGINILEELQMKKIKMMKDLLNVYILFTLLLYFS